MGRKFYRRFRELCDNPFFAIGSGILLLFLAEGMNHPLPRLILLSVAWLCIFAGTLDAFPPSSRTGWIYLTVFFTVGGVALFYKLSRAPDSINDMAILAVKSVACDPFIPEAGKPLCITVEIINVGKGAAENVEGVGMFEALPRGESLDFTYKHIIPTKFGTLGAGLNFPILFFPVTSVSMGGERPLTSELLDRLNSGDPMLFVHGHITYQDSSGASHWLDYCVYLHVPIRGSYDLYKDHNGGDRDSL